MKNLLFILLLPLLFSCTKTKTIYVDKPVHDTTVVYQTSYTFMRNAWVNVSHAGFTLTFSQDSIFETLPPYYTTAFGYPYTLLSKDTINLPTRNAKVYLNVTKDSLIYTEYPTGSTEHFYRD